jgi:hypothetical protein
MSMTPAGEVVLSVGEKLQIFEPGSMEFVREIDAPTAGLTDMTLAPNAKVYGINGASLVEIDPETWAARQIAWEGGTFLAADADSKLYFARKEKLYRFVWE